MAMRVLGFLWVLLGWCFVGAGADLVPLGAGSYSTLLPAGAREPQAAIYKMAELSGPTPTSDWWTSLLWQPFSQPHFSHPLAMTAQSNGLRIAFPSVNASTRAIIAGMPHGANDLVLGHSAQEKFPETRVAQASDWFVTTRFAEGPHQMQLSYGHGSPFVYALYQGGSARLTFPKPPLLWHGDANSPVLGMTTAGKHYALFGPTGSTWTGLGTTSWTNQADGRPYFALAVLPDNSPATLAQFLPHAYTHVTKSEVAWTFDAQSSLLTTRYQLSGKTYEGIDAGFLLALYPHQWRNTTQALLPLSYPSVRGPMKLLRGHAFVTRLPFHGVLPSLPNAGGTDTNQLADLLRKELTPPGSFRDTYWDGKWLGKRASLIPIAQTHGLTNEARQLQTQLQERLEGWLTASDSTGNPKTKGLFYYNTNWGTLIGYPASYGSDKELNDHHFHYGYFLRAAAEIARLDPAWAADSRWGGMLRLLIRDIASANRQDPLFPFLRCFDPYAGHSWASGHALFGDGNNQESSSEAMNAWAGIILLGEALGDMAMRDLGIYLYTTEGEAINEYWFNVHGDNFPPAYTYPVATMIWGGKSANETWFTANPEQVHGINWLPLHGASLYLGLYPEYVEKNYQALVTANKGAPWDVWEDIILMYRALSKPEESLKALQSAAGRLKPEDGNSLANTYHWITTLNTLGHVEKSLTANHPLHAVFQKGNTRTYCVYNMSSKPLPVRFSDGHLLTCKGPGFVTESKPR